MQPSAMRAMSIVLLILGILALGIGGLVLAASGGTHVSTTSFYLVPGNYCSRFQFDTLASGTVSVTFQADTGAVDQFVMTEAQHAAFVSGGGLSYLAAGSGSSGTIFATLPSGGTYFVETCHASGYETSSQTGTHTITVDAVETTPFAVGAVTLVVGGVLTILGVYYRGVAKKRAAAMPPPYATPWAAGTPWSYPGPAYGPGGAPPGALPYPAPPSMPGPTAMPPAQAEAPIATILVTVENASASDEAVELLANGVSVATLQVAAGASGQASVRVRIPSPAGSTVIVEAATRGTRRTQQSVLVGAQEPAQASLRIG